MSAPDIFGRHYNAIGFPVALWIDLINAWREAFFDDIEQRSILRWRLIFPHARGICKAAFTRNLVNSYENSRSLREHNRPPSFVYTSRKLWCSVYMGIGKRTRLTKSAWYLVLLALWDEKPSKANSFPLVFLHAYGPTVLWGRVQTLRGKMVGNHATILSARVQNSVGQYSIRTPERSPPSTTCLPTMATGNERMVHTLNDGPDCCLTGRPKRDMQNTPAILHFSSSGPFLKGSG